tara:strand:- start:40 stop:513 length:474 start_codon:yes stop_codon:yes gene_type:complete
MIIKRVWAMPSHQTFDIKPIKEFIKENIGSDYVDPFPYPFKEDAITYLKKIKTNSKLSLVFDPPYSQRQLKEMYHSNGISLDHSINNSYWSKCKKEIARIIKPNGRVISFGWNSGGVGKKNGFEIEKILLVNHGSQHNDTICTLEVKATSELALPGF